MEPFTSMTVRKMAAPSETTFNPPYQVVKVLRCDHCPDASVFGWLDLDATSDGATGAGCGNHLQTTFCWKATGCHLSRWWWVGVPLPGSPRFALRFS